MESEAFFKSIENHLDNSPYRVMFGSGDWTCTIAKWKGKMIGPWTGLDGKVHNATGKTFELEFCTVARWKKGEIVEENLFYDQVGFLRPLRANIRETADPVEFSVQGGEGKTA